MRGGGVVFEISKCRVEFYGIWNSVNLVAFDNAILAKEFDTAI